MSTLAELLEQGELAQAAARAAQTKKEREEEQEHEREAAALVAKAKLLGRELMGAAFDELVRGEPMVNYHRTEVSWRMAMGPGDSVFRFEFDRRGGDVARLATGSRNSDVDLRLPADPEQLAVFIANRKAEYDYCRQKAIENAVKEISHQDLEFSDDPQAIFENCVRDWPDTADELRPALEAEMTRRAEKDRAEVARREHQAEMQSKVWFPIAVWRVTYAAWTFQDGDEFPVQVGTKETAYSLAPQADGDGWWPLCHHGKKTLTLLPHLLKVEEVVLEGWGCDEAKLVCGRYPIDGASVLVPPHDAVAYGPA